MRYYHGLMAALGALLLAGCAHPAFDRAQADAVNRVQNLRITCANATDCTVKWGRAMQWVTQNSTYKLRIANDYVITTEGPLDDGMDAVQSAFTVNRVPAADGSAEIEFESACADMFGCVPTHEMLLASFGEFVMGMGAERSATPTNGGSNGAPNSSSLGQPAPVTGPTQADSSQSPTAKSEVFGVGVFQLNAAGSAALHLSSDHGMLVNHVDDKTPASRAGIVVGDVILSAASQKLASLGDLKKVMATMKPGSTMPVQILRGGKELDLTVRF